MLGDLLRIVLLKTARLSLYVAPGLRYHLIVVANGYTEHTEDEMGLQERAYQRAPETAQNGPAWLDVYVFLDRLEKELSARVEFTSYRVTSVGNRLGLYTRVKIGDRLVEGLGVGYGPAYNNSAKTYPAALYNLLMAFESRRDEMTPLERLAAWGEMLHDDLA